METRTWARLPKALTTLALVLLAACDHPGGSATPHEAVPPPGPGLAALVPEPRGGRAAIPAGPVEPGSSSVLLAVAPARTAARAASPPPPDESAAVRAPTAWQAEMSWSPGQRLAHATRAKKPEVLRLFAAAGVAFPPKDLLFRVYKQEKELEVWAGDGASALHRVATYGICAASGELGPKRAEGDLQVPEGFYRFGYFAPGSAFYLAALIDYPNLSDRIRGAATPGGQILMHGKCASIGCVSMTDERMEELYLMAYGAWRDGGHRTDVHIFPARDLDALLEDEEHAAHHDFWREIGAGHDAFEATRRIPKVTIEKDGRYVVAAVR
jgi:hypothetical protein